MVSTLGNELLFDSEKGAQIPADKRGLGLVFQSYALWPHRTVFQNIAYGLRIRRVSVEEMRERVQRLLRRLASKAYGVE